MSMSFTEQEHTAKDIFSHMLELWKKDRDEDVGTVEEFVSFSKEYLTTNRPMQSFHPEANIGTILTNNVRVILAPSTGEKVAGDMAPVPGDTTINQGSVPMRGNS